MNIWALNKDSAIKLLLLRLDEIIELEQFDIILSDDLNIKAIRFSDSQIDGLSAYIYCYGQDHARYGIHLELPVHASSQSINSEIYENIDFERLVDILKIHFNLI